VAIENRVFFQHGSIAESRRA
jgi:hypothetical protein